MATDGISLFLIGTSTSSNLFDLDATLAYDLLQLIMEVSFTDYEAELEGATVTIFAFEEPHYFPMLPDQFLINLQLAIRNPWAWLQKTMVFFCDQGVHRVTMGQFVMAYINNPLSKAHLGLGPPNINVAHTVTELLWTSHEYMPGDNWKKFKLEIKRICFFAPLLLSMANQNKALPFLMILMCSDDEIVDFVAKLGLDSSEASVAETIKATVTRFWKRVGELFPNQHLLDEAVKRRAVRALNSWLHETLSQHEGAFEPHNAQPFRRPALRPVRR